MNKLKELRKEKSLTQQGLADDIGVHFRTLQNWENGKADIKPDKLLGYSDFPAVNLRDLLFHEIKALKEYKVLRVGFENYISENDVLAVIDKYTN